MDIAWINDTALFLHVLSAIGMVGGGIVQVMAGSQLVTARTGDGLATWARFTRSAGLLIAASAVLSLFTGGHLAGAVWSRGEANGFAEPFITLGVIALFVLAPIGPMLGGARLRRLAIAADEVGAEPVPARLRAAAADPALWGPVYSLLGVGIGFVWLMTTKPGWAGGALGLMLTFAAGWVVGAVVARRNAPAPADVPA